MQYPVLDEEKMVRQMLGSVVIDSCHLCIFFGHVLSNARRKVYPLHVIDALLFRQLHTLFKVGLLLCHSNQMYSSKYCRSSSTAKFQRQQQRLEYKLSQHQHAPNHPLLH
jgi:hypothetical protein